MVRLCFIGLANLIKIHHETTDMNKTVLGIMGFLLLTAGLVLLRFGGINVGLPCKVALLLCVAGAGFLFLAIRPDWLKRYLITLNTQHCYRLLTGGCIVHALFLSACVIFNLANGALAYPVAGLLCAWPAWGVFLWEYGGKCKLAVIIPMTVGLLILLPVLYELAFAILVFQDGCTCDVSFHI